MTRKHESEIRRLLSLYFIAGSPNCLLSPPDTLLQAISGGVTMFQFREKGAGALVGADAEQLGRQLQAICRAHGIPFIVNDDIGLALKLDADGVHVGQDDAPAAILRAKLGPSKIVGVSAHTLEEAQRAISDGADYLGVGPVYPTSSKPDAKAAAGTALIGQLRAAGITVPVVGIGGITPQNAAPVIAAGADGVSVISAIASAEHPELMAKRFRQALQLHNPATPQRP
ncbi:thiamine phosphate synthase [Paenibacillus sp. NFR01]|uniref:thiamine phosphate synthase n=1 Tax=Paenibacillus sp. NFR01 TaxID=1566279 RepID=UPI0008C6AD75|nr:thiamine phosphate synthase [Paenibacillus sp. NFR01]SET34517.1 thiamine-phosphate pyrophosphorylase [Paenibacillus sp. NFR01]